MDYRTPPPIKTHHPSDTTTGFTLVEMLVVVGIIGLLLALTTPIWNTLTGSSNISKSSSDIQGILEQARAHARANNTYTYVGIWEVDALKAQQGSTNLTQGIGRVAVGVFYSLNGLEPLKSGQSIALTNTAQLGKLNAFDNLHITDLSLQNSGGLNRSPSDFLITSNNPTTAPPGFQWPLLSANPQYPNGFVKIIEFSPQGCARVQTSSTYESSLKNYLELGLVPSHGNSTNSSDMKNSAILQINGITGAVRLYRP